MSPTAWLEMPFTLRSDSRIYNLQESENLALQSRGIFSFPLKAVNRQRRREINAHVICMRGITSDWLITP